MSYSAEISRKTPGLIFFLVDQSTSMGRPWRNSGKSLSQGTADAVNHLLDSIQIRCTRSEGVRHYFDIGIIGYGSTINSGLSSIDIGRLPISNVEIADTRVEERTRMREDGVGGLVEEKVKIPIWLDPVASGNTHMCEALDTCFKKVDNWISSHSMSFPPIIINITDGEATDGDPMPYSEKIRNLSTSDGNALLFNIHISPLDANPIVFSSTESSLPDEHARRLFRMSSLIPQKIKEQANKDNISFENEARGFAFNADLVTLIQVLDIGTSPTGKFSEEFDQ